MRSRAPERRPRARRRVGAVLRRRRGPRPRVSLRARGGQERAGGRADFGHERERVRRQADRVGEKRAHPARLGAGPAHPRQPGRHRRPGPDRSARSRAHDRVRPDRARLAITRALSLRAYRREQPGPRGARAVRSAVLQPGSVRPTMRPLPGQRAGPPAQRRPERARGAHVAAVGADRVAARHQRRTRAHRVLPRHPDDRRRGFARSRDLAGRPAGAAGHGRDRGGGDAARPAGAARGRAGGRAAAVAPAGDGPGPRRARAPQAAAAGPPDRASRAHSARRPEARGRGAHRGGRVAREPRSRGSGSSRPRSVGAVSRRRTCGARTCGRHPSSPPISPALRSTTPTSSRRT